jgi:hypothetical protein
MLQLVNDGSDELGWNRGDGVRDPECVERDDELRWNRRHGGREPSYITAVMPMLIMLINCWMSNIVENWLRTWFKLKPS